MYNRPSVMQTQTLRQGILSQLQEQIRASNTDEAAQEPATNGTHHHYQDV